MDSKAVGKSAHVNLENGERSSKMPTATLEQLDLAKLLATQGNDAEHKRSVAMLQDLANCTEDEAVTALHDCDNDIRKAVELLLDKGHSAFNEDWHTTGRKSRAKHNSVHDSDGSVSVHAKGDRGKEQHKREVVNNRTARTKTDGPEGSVNQESHDSLPNAKHRRGPKNLRNTNSISTESMESRSKDTNLRQVNRAVSFKDQRSGAKHVDHSDGWDPYTEYGEWGGEAIEVVNSNASLARGLQPESTPTDDLFVETDSKPPQEASSTRATDSSADVLSPKSIPHSDDDSLFISKAVTKPPPQAFTKLPDVPVFIVPDALPLTGSNFSFRFGGNQEISNRKSATTTVTVNANKSPSSNNKPDNMPHDLEPPFYQAASAHCKLPTYEMSKPVNRSAPASEETKVEQSENYSSNQFQNVNFASKSPAVSTVQTGAAFNPERPNAQPGYLESSLKNYLLENLPREVTKLSVTNSSIPNETPVQFTLPVASQPVSSSFTQGQSSSGTTIQQQLTKAPVPHATTHASFHASQPPVASGTSQQPQSTALPPGMTHFISQFTPTPYHMFNLPGNSGNTPAVLEQLFHQQHRMFYDMHMHQQAATTAQSLLTSSSESPAASKPHSLPGPMNHVTATGAAIRPDLLASAMGHAPQMLPTGHPFFSYPGFVLMNGYPNTFLNQQQSGGDSNGPTQASAHGPSPMTQAPPQSSSSQTFSGMKPMNAAYEEFLDMKYGDPSKQVGYKSQSSTNFGTYPGHMPPVDGVVPKMSAGHSTANGVLNAGFGMNAASGGSAPSFLPQYYQPGTSTSAYLNAAVAVAQQQQQQQQGASQNNAANQSNAGVSGGGQSGGNPGQMHQLGNGHAQSLVLGSGGGQLHHAHHHPSQRTVVSHQH